MTRNLGRGTDLEGRLPPRAAAPAPVLLVILLLLALGPAAFGQAVAKPAPKNPAPLPALPALSTDAHGKAADEDVAENVFVPADRHLLQEIADARKLAADNRWAEAVRALGTILDEPEDYFFQPDKDAAAYRSLKSEAERQLGQMPAEARESYELQYGAKARRMLDEAIESGNLGRLAEISRRYFHTKAGRQATYVLGLSQFDQGRPLVAALTLDRLRHASPDAHDFEPSLSLWLATCRLSAGEAGEAGKVLVDLQKRDPGLRVRAGEREVAIFASGADPIAWLVTLVGPAASASDAASDQWPMFRGDPSRNAPGEGGAPLLNVRWRIETADDPQVAAALEQSERAYAEQGAPIIASLYPLAVGRTILMRTARTLVAVDFTNGKRLWEVPADDLDRGDQSPDAQRMQTAWLSNIGQRIWGDLAYGTLSSDGRRVFSIEDLDLRFTANDETAFQFGRFPRVFGQSSGEGGDVCNRLAAHDIATGKLVWNLGGPATGRALRQSGAFFLGPPLPLMGQLFVLTEAKGEIRLESLDPGTGDRLWSQQLAMVDRGVAQESPRRWSGASPSYADGVLVCPTSTGALVAVDVATRSLLWGHRFRRSSPNPHSQFAPNPGPPNPLNPGWIDSGVCLAERRVLATPAEADSLYCIDLITGDLLWKCPRQNDLYLACADRDGVVLVGRRGLHALRLSDGKPAWDGRSIEFPDDATPSGRGFRSGDRYFVPLSSAQVAAVDLRAGKIVGTSKSRDGTPPGNLVCHQGQILSQGLRGIDAYRQFDAVAAEAARRLAARPDDAEALALRAEILLDEGKPQEAVATFLLARPSAIPPRSRQMLSETLLEGLRSDFAAYRPHAPELERLADDPTQHAAYLRAMAEGLRREGNAVAAFDFFQQLVSLKPGSSKLDAIDKHRSVRRDQWLRGQLALLRAAAGDVAAARIDAVVQVRLKAALATGTIDSLRAFLDVYGGLPSARPAQVALVRALRNAGRAVEADLAEGRDVEAPPAVVHRVVWAVGKAEVTTTSMRSAVLNPYSRVPIEFRGNRRPYFTDLSLRYEFRNDHRSAIVCRDGFGRQRWQLVLPEDAQQPQNTPYGGRTSAHARAYGHLLLVAVGSKLMAIGAAGLPSDKSPRLLWSQELSSFAGDASDGNPFGLGWANLPWQAQHQVAMAMQRAAQLGAFTGRTLCLQRFRSLIGVDPLTGGTLWTRNDLPPGSDLFGDDDHVFVVPREREEVIVLRAGDGERIGTGHIPRVAGRQALPDGEIRPVFGGLEDCCLALLGRRMLLWWSEGNQRALVLVDPLESRDVWPERRFSAKARACVVGDEAVAVLDPVDGRFLLASLPDGRVIADQQLKGEAEPAATGAKAARPSVLYDIALLDDGDQYFLVTRRSRPPGRATSIQALPGATFRPIQRGRIYAFHRDGRPAWPAPIEVKDQVLLAEQPVHLPVLTFGCITYLQDPNGNHQPKMRMWCVDKRNGRTLFEKEYANQHGAVEVSGDPDRKTVALAMLGETVTLAFTDKPLPPGASGPAKPSQPANPAVPLWDALQKGFDRMIEGAQPSDDSEEPEDPFAE